MSCGYCGSDEHDRDNCLKEAIALYKRKHSNILKLLDDMVVELGNQRLTEPPTDKAMILIRGSKV